MRKEEVKIRINKKSGTAHIEAEGFQGEGCECLGDMELALGAQISREDKDEKFQHVIPDPAFINQGL